MNVFVIPSWYPSQDHPINGIFNKEQTIALAKLYPQANFCISLWGQQDESNLLWGKDHLYNIIKILNFLKEKESESNILPNLFEKYTPALTWTQKLLSGNISKIISANESNLKQFEKRVGKVNVIHAHSAYPGGYIAYALSKRFNIPYLITEHITPFPSKYYLTSKGDIKTNIMNAISHAHYIIAVSPALQHKIIDLDLQNSVCIPNLTDEEFFKPTLTVPDKGQIILFMLGRMVEQKGVPILLNALNKLSDNQIKLRIGGDGENIDEYKNIASKLNLRNISWLGLLNRTEVRNELQQCHILVLPSLHENLPLVLLEAIACGKPIIATKCGGPESIVNEDNGLLAEVGDSDDLAHKISWMIDHYDRYKPEIIRADFMNRFSQKVVGNQIMELYKKVMV